MNPIGTIPSLPALPAAPQVPAVKSGDVLPIKPAEPQIPLAKPDLPDIKALEQQRFDRVQKAATQISNLYVVSDRRFTIFKDATGQYVTRFTSLRDGKVTYIPEPELVKHADSKLNILA